MSETAANQIEQDLHVQGGLPISVPPVYAWPPRPGMALRWIWTGVLFPWGLLFLLLAVFSWALLLPPLPAMQTFALDWVVLIWLRNVLLLTVIVSSLYWLLYVKRSQFKASKFNPQWQLRDSSLFLFGSQLKDNVFWSITNGCSIWTIFDATTYWLYAKGYVAMVTWDDAPFYLLIVGFFSLFWSYSHFYFIHRLLHCRFLYKPCHALHHRNTSPTPWSGISMHPVEHLLYFSVFCIFWVLPAHPVLVIWIGLFQGIVPVLTHCGFAQLRIGNSIRFITGDLFHQLHHKYFELNYGNRPAPLDKLFGSWHDGTSHSLAFIRGRRRNG